MRKKTKIMVTVGPACSSVEILTDMMKSGMNIARLNFSHGTYESHKESLQNIRLAEKKAGMTITVIQDLQGPKIRLGILPEEGLKAEDGDEIVLNTKETKYKGGDIPFVFPGLQKHLKVRERLLIDDGRMEVQIHSIKGSRVFCKVIEGGVIKSRKGVNFPDSSLRIPPLSEKDKKDLKYGLSLGVHSVALSFVHKAEDVILLLELIKKYEKNLKIKSEYPVQIIVKIERREAMENLKEILEVCDGVMIARGDLGLEMPAAEVPLMQKRIIGLCKDLAKPVIVATQMLDSMQECRRPSRAEVSDVANAVFDHADVLMLSNETASGKYPLKTVKVMNHIIRTTERSAYLSDQTIFDIGNHGSVDISLAQTACVVADDIGAKIILAASLTGETGRLISSYRPFLPIIVATSSERVSEQLNISWGIQPFILLPCKTIEQLIQSSIKHILKYNIAEKGDKMVVVAGEPVGHAGNLNLIEVRDI
ncbi:pyruvate kinase [Patescibacteria group bacterium]|nr:pyruvate kinase [Patescibacteria group bacterium]